MPYKGCETGFMRYDHLKATHSCPFIVVFHSVIQFIQKKWSSDEYENQSKQ